MTRHKRSFFKLLLAAACFVGTTRAEFIIAAPTVLASAGSSGTFDILLIATPNGGVIGGAFSFEISTASPDVDFTGVSTHTTAAPYIFAGDSFAEINGFPLATKTGQELIASDAANSGFVDFDGAFSLGEVSYTIARSATFPIAITFSSAGTSLSDPSGYLFPVTTVAGQLTTVVPEPSLRGLLAACLTLCALLVSRRGRCAPE